MPSFSSSLRNCLVSILVFATSLASCWAASLQATQSRASSAKAIQQSYTPVPLVILPGQRFKGTHAEWLTVSGFDACAAPEGAAQIVLGTTWTLAQAHDCIRIEANQSRVPVRVMTRKGSSQREWWTVRTQGRLFSGQAAWRLQVLRPNGQSVLPEFASYP